MYHTRAFIRKIGAAEEEDVVRLDGLLNGHISHAPGASCPLGCSFGSKGHVVKPGKVLIFGLLGLIVAQVIAWWQQSASPLLASVLTVAAGSIPLVLAYLKERPSKAKSTPAAGPQYPPGLAQPEREPIERPTFPLRGLLVGLVILALVGGGIAYAASYLVGRITGNEPSAVQRLAKPVSGSAGALRVRIDEVGVSDNYTQVRLTATNRADFPVTIPLFNNCQLAEAGQDALEAKTGFVTSVIEVPPGSIPITKRIVFSGTPSDAATSLTLACSTLFWQGFGQPQSLQVKRIALTETR
jgi:hypothetical protein